MRITATPRVHYHGLFKLRHESATKRAPPAGYFTRSYGRVFFLIHGSKAWCSCNMCHHLVVMSWLYAMRDVLLGCLNSMLDHCIISMFLDHTCFVTPKSSLRFFTNFIVFHQILQQKSSSPGTSHLQPFRLIRVSKTETQMCSPTNKQKSQGYQGCGCPM